MPEGIIPELLIAAGLIAIVVVAVFVSRRPRRRPPEIEEPPRAAEAEAATAVAVPDQVAPEVPVAEAPPVVAEPAPVLRVTLRDRLSKSRNFLIGRLTEALGGAAGEEVWDDVEAVLIQADIGVDLAGRIATDLRATARERKATTAADVKQLLADELLMMFDRDLDRALSFGAGGVSVWLVVGVNGSGKTTTIGKLARDLTNRGRKVALAASDTFRAAADEQLELWAQRAGAHVVKHQPGADPGAVAFDAYQFARARGFDVLMVDTAGRLHTKTPLMDELAKVRRVIAKESDVHEALLVIDATSGQNGLAQAREFAQAAGVTGIVLTKLDGTAKGGIALAIEDTLGIPIKLIGVGESIDDLEPFEPKTFVDALLD